MSSESSIRIFAHKKYPRLRSTIQKLTHAPIVFEKFDLDKFLKDVIKQKRAALKLVGIREWEVSRSHFNDKEKVITLEGTFQSSKGETELFQEVYRYHSSGSVQFLASWPASMGNGKDYFSNFMKTHAHEFNYD